MPGDHSALRAAIQEANFNPGLDTIEFDIPGCPNDICVIDIDTAGGNALPDIQSPVVIDGATQPGNAAVVSADPVEVGDRLLATATDVEDNSSKFSPSVAAVFLDRLFRDGFE